MRSAHAPWKFVAGALAALVLGCTSDKEPTSSIKPLLGEVGGQAEGVKVCKSGAVGTFTFTVDANGGRGTLLSGSQFDITLTDPAQLNCTMAWVAIGERDEPNTDIHVAELVPDGMHLDSIHVGKWDNGVITTMTYTNITDITVTANFSTGYFLKFYNSPTCTDQNAGNYGGPMPCVYGKTFGIGPSSMEGHLKITANTWFNGGYSFKFKNNTHSATDFTVNAKVEVPVSCPQGGGPGGTILIPLGTVVYHVPAGNTDWLPTGDANSIRSWMGAVRTPDLCGGYPMDNSRGGIFTATVQQNPASGSLVDFRFKYRNPAAKGKVDTNCTDPTEPKRNDAATCGASWSETVRDP